MHKGKVAIAAEGKTHDADVVVAGAGAAGLAAAIAARDLGATVLVIEENDDIGGHAMLSGGNIHIGGGHSLQRQLGIEDSPELFLRDWTESDGPETRYNDRSLLQRFARESVATFDFLVENGVEFIPSPDPVTDRRYLGPGSVPRIFRCSEWPIAAEVIAPHRGRNGSGLVRSLARSARAKGVGFLPKHRMTTLITQDGRVTGLSGQAAGATFMATARKGVILATGGNSGNVTLRRMFDPRLTSVYPCVGEEYSRQSGDGEMAAMAIGASLWATANQTYGARHAIAKPHHIGCRCGYKSLVYEVDSPIFDRAGATGLTVRDWQDLILVKQSGRRFWDETDDSLHYINAALRYDPGAADVNGGGAVWAIFDSAAAAREGWTTVPPHVDRSAFFATADTLEDLALEVGRIHPSGAIDPAELNRTVARYNGFVEAGRDSDFGKPSPRHRIETAPFHAAWATPVVHDSLTGLRTSPNCEVIDLAGNTIPGLYCAGESQGGLALHGLGRCLVFGRIAGRAAASTG